MKNRINSFMAGFTIFHAIGIFLMLAGGFIGSAPEELTDKMTKLRTEARTLEEVCVSRPYKNGRTVREFCTVATDDVKAVRAAAASAHDAAVRVVGVRASFDGVGLKMAFQITFTQVVGGFVFFFELLKSWLRRRDEKEKLPT